jgi:hypothetical protein
MHFLKMHNPFLPKVANCATFQNIRKPNVGMLNLGGINYSFIIYDL